MKNKNDNKEIFRALAIWSQLGISMAASIVVSIIIGHFLDNWLLTSPWFLIVFAILGTASAFKIMYDMVIKEWLK